MGDGNATLDYNLTYGDDVTELMRYAPSYQQLIPWNLTDNEKSFAWINNIVYYSFLFPVALCGNIFTISAVFMVLKVKKSVPNMLIGVLAFADLTSIFICHIIAIVSMTQQKWLGENVCRFQSVMAFSYFKLGFFSKVCISIDRLIALKYPLKYRSIVTTRRVVGIIVFNIFFSIASSALTWIVDGEYIKPIETWDMCTNEFYHYTNYKLAIVISEGSVFLIGVMIFLVGNINVVKVMLELGNRMKKLKANNDSALSKLRLTPLSVVTTVSVGLTDIAAVTESDASTDDKNNNDTDNDSEKDTGDELATSFSKRSSKKEDNPRVDLLTFKSLTSLNDEIQKKDSLESYNHLSPHLENNRLSTGNRLTVNGVNNIGGREKKKSIFKKVVELSSKALTNKMQNRQRKELQFAKLVMVIVTVFVILWIPFMFTIYYEHSNEMRIHPLIVDISMKLVFANACINPILYGLFNANFRKAYVYYVKMLGHYLSCKRMARPSGKEMPWSVKRNPTPSTIAVSKVVTTTTS